MKTLIAVLFVCLFFSCRKNQNFPHCVQTVIDNGSSVYRSIEEYRYNNNTVYLFVANCCDRLNDLYSENCTILCSPTGGFSGGGDGRCTDFTRNAQHIRRVWEP